MTSTEKNDDNEERSSRPFRIRMFRMEMEAHDPLAKWLMFAAFIAGLLTWLAIAFILKDTPAALTRFAALVAS